MAGVEFIHEETVRFSHCDPAGIVFFPQYLVMLNTLVERWFDDGLGVRYADFIMQRRLGLPTVRLEVDFTAVCHIGDRLTQRLAVKKVGCSSLELQVVFVADDRLCARLRQVLVCTSLDTHRPQRLPDDVRAGIDRYLMS